jgi:predicted methyltransferase
MMRLRTIRVAALAIATVVVPALAQDGSHDQNRDKWQKVDEIFAAMGVKAGAVVADVGAGGGYFTTRLSRAVGDTGRVYAVDVNADALGRLRTRLTGEGLTNVELVHGSGNDPKLPPGSLDAALIVNAYHEMNEHQAMLAALKAALKPDGRLVIVEPISASRRKNPRTDQTRNHEIGIEFVKQDAREAGFAEVQVQDPFTKRADAHGDEEWLLVLTPAPVSTGRSSQADDWKSAALRISPEDFKRLAPTEVLVLDVRDPDSYRRGHLPGAILMTPEELSKPEAAARLASETRRIITYCS